MGHIDKGIQAPGAAPRSPAESLFKLNVKKIQAALESHHTLPLGLFYSHTLITISVGTSFLVITFPVILTDFGRILM